MRRKVGISVSAEVQWVLFSVSVQDTACFSSLEVVVEFSHVEGRLRVGASSSRSVVDWDESQLGHRIVYLLGGREDGILCLQVIEEINMTCESCMWRFCAWLAADHNFSTSERASSRLGKMSIVVIVREVHVIFSASSHILDFWVSILCSYRTENPP